MSKATESKVITPKATMSKAVTSKATIYDVAKKAGVGIGTVSRVLNNHLQVRPATRQLVMNAIKDLGFRPSTAARQLSLQRQVKYIGVITQPFINYYSFSERLQGIQKALGQKALNQSSSDEQNSDYELLLYTVSSFEHYQTQLEAIAQTRAVEGLMIIDLELTHEQQDLLSHAGVPVVGVNHLQAQSWPCVATNNLEGGYLATQYLLGLGHERIAYVGDTFVKDYTHNTSRERFTGFKKALDEVGLGLPESYVRLGQFDYDVAKENASTLLGLKTPPTAIFAMSDIQALACIAAVKEAGLSVPQAMSVIGYDDLDLSYHTGLTTVRQHLELSGQKGLEHLLALLEGKKSAPPKLPKPEVVVRETTGALKQT
jgi:DNA-binding LacI/PurR family transcriptional regulator